MTIRSRTEKQSSIVFGDYFKTTISNDQTNKSWPGEALDKKDAEKIA